MALTINTNLSSLIVQKNLTSATNSLNSSIERMTTGLKINHAVDNAAGFSIATNWKTQLGSLDIAAQNISMGIDLLTTAEDNYSLLTTHLQRIRDLTEQAANGTYGSVSRSAIKQEITARLDEIDRISQGVEYNGIDLMKGMDGNLQLQVGITQNHAVSQISLSNTLFAKSTATALLGVASKDTFATNCIGTSASAQLATLDTALSNISNRVTQLGAAQNRLQSAQSSNNVQIQNLTSSLSTLRDSDVASESSRYIQAQILQQAASTLLATANQTPSIALNLL